MQVENLAIKLRNRSNWEAIDLGFALARQWYSRLWGSWLIGALPVYTGVMILIYVVENTVFRSLIFILFWWLKPLYEQPLLYILSRQLFSESVTFKDVLKNYFIIIKPQLGSLLLWRRLNLSRSFNNPVAMLEGLTGKERRSRLNVLHAHQSNTSQWLTIICVHLEILFYFAFLLFIFALIPSELISDFTLFTVLSEENLGSIVLNNITYFIAVSIVAPMYVAAGFALYITRRTKLEGWDIELSFKRMKNRLENLNKNEKINFSPQKNSLLACLSFIVIILVTSLFITPSYAKENINFSNEQSKTTIEKVLKHEDFGKTTTKNSWTYIGSAERQQNEKGSGWLNKFFKWLFEKLFDKDISTAFNIIEIIIWLTIAVFIAWLFNKYSHWLAWINLPSRSKIKHNKSMPNQILGMDVTKESLPEDILEKFSSLVNTKKYREALSLLYRATLSAIIHQGDIEIPSSATEQECSQMVSRYCGEDESKFFSILTKAWVRLAYGNSAPSLETLSHLREGWNKHYKEAL